MWSIPRPQVAELNSGPDGHRMDQCPVIFSESFRTFINVEYFKT